MKLNIEDILNYHCPRWSELPEIELYIDQVIYILQNNLSIFSHDANSPMITTNMINNYVKNRVLQPPTKKKYNRSHLAILFAICILKKHMVLSDITISINIMTKNYSIEDGYNLFCDEFEKILKYTFDPSRKKIPTYIETETREIATLRAILTTFANSVLVDRLIALR